WLLVFRCLGFGYFTEGKNRRQWARDFCEWINNYCVYRRERDITQIFIRHRLKPAGIEREYIRYRKLPLFTPRMLRKLGFMVLVCRKAVAPCSPRPNAYSQSDH